MDSLFIQYIVDALWGQPIKLIQAVSNSEFHEYWWNDVLFIFLSPPLCALSLEKVRGLFLNIKLEQLLYQIRFKNQNLLGSWSVKVVFLGAKNSRSWHIRVTKYSSFNTEFKFLVKSFHTQFLKQSMFKASEALHKEEGTKKTHKKCYPINIHEILK